MKTIRVWDLPTRIFHWCFALTVLSQFITASLGGEAMVWHVRLGYLALTLVLFRLIWGVVGSTSARFRTFLCAPKTVWQFFRALMKKESPATWGHNPMGGYAVMLMLLLVLLQASLGLFSNDDIFIEGPLFPLISKALSDILTGWHGMVATLVALMIGLHLLAVLYHQFTLKEKIIDAMITGRKSGDHPPELTTQPPWKALVALLIAAALTALIVFIGDWLAPPMDDASFYE